MEVPKVHYSPYSCTAFELFMNLSISTREYLAILLPGPVARQQTREEKWGPQAITIGSATTARTWTNVHKTVTLLGQMHSYLLKSALGYIHKALSKFQNDRTSTVLRKGRELQIWSVRRLHRFPCWNDTISNQSLQFAGLPAITGTRRPTAGAAICWKSVNF